MGTTETTRRAEMRAMHHEELLGVEMVVATAIRLGKSPKDVLEIRDEPHYGSEGGGNTPIRNITLVARDLLDQMVICSEFHSRHHGLGFRFDRLLKIIEQST